MIANAFTCTGPYALLIMLGIKRVENRSRAPEPRKGRCAVSCSKSFCKEEYGNFVHWASRALPEEDFDLIPAWSDVKDWPGKIVGACDYSTRGRNDLVLEAEPRPLESSLRSCACARQELWDEGYPYWWDLSEVVNFDFPIPCRGNVGMWRMPDDLQRRVATADDLARSVGTKISTADDARRIVVTALLALLLPVVALAEVGGYTNHAGNVVSGWPVKLTAREVELAVPPAKTGEAYPLSIFPEPEQRRIAADFGTPRVPPDVKRAVDGAKKAMARSRKRAEKGLCTKEESDAFCAKSEAALDRYLDGQVKAGVLTPAERQLLQSRRSRR